MTWTIEIIPTAEKELKAFPADIQAHFLRISELLEEFGPQKVHEPHVKHLDGKLWEIRLKGKNSIARAVYFLATGKKIMVVRLFGKKTQKTPRGEIEIARERMKEEQSKAVNKPKKKHGKATQKTKSRTAKRRRR